MYTSTVDSVITIQTHFMVITVAISQRRTKNTRKTASHCTRTNITPKSVLFSAEIEKKRKYSAACSAYRAHFTPLCFSVDGLTGGQASSFIKRLASGLAVWWDKSYSTVLGWVRARLGFEDGAAI